MQDSELPLRDLHLPDPIGWWPLAIGWWILIGLAVIVAAWLIHKAVLKRQHNAARRFALREFQGIETAFRQDGDAVTLGKRLSQLLRRAMLAYSPRADVAGLTGEEWLRWLDRDLPVPYFHTDGGKSLLQLPYRDPQGDFADIDTNALLAAVKMRLSTPVGGLR